MFQPRAREWDTSHLSWFLLDTHVAQLIRIDVRNEQVRASDLGEHKQTNYNGDYEHRFLLSVLFSNIYINHYFAEKLFTQQYC